MTNYYIESSQIEKHWFAWAIANKTPQLEPYRHSSSLLTKVGVTEDGYPDPYSERKKHAILIGSSQIEFDTHRGEIQLYNQDTQDVKMPLELSRSQELKYFGELKTSTIIPADYVLEEPTNQSWHALLTDISVITEHIMTKFNLNDDDRLEIGSDALLQIIKKLEGDKLRYYPNRAPVFNLLTTAITRCIYTSLQKHNKRISNRAKLTDDLVNGRVKINSRSLAAV